MQCNEVKYSTVQWIKIQCCAVHYTTAVHCQSVKWRELWQTEVGGESAIHLSTGHGTITYHSVQCSAVQCNAVQWRAVQCSAVQCSAMQWSAVYDMNLANSLPCVGRKWRYVQHKLFDKIFVLRKLLFPLNFRVSPASMATKKSIGESRLPTGPTSL